MKKQSYIVAYSDENDVEIKIALVTADCELEAAFKHPDLPFHSPDEMVEYYSDGSEDEDEVKDEMEELTLEGLQERLIESGSIIAVELLSDLTTQPVPPKTEDLL